MAVISKLATPYYFENFGEVRWSPRTQAITTIVVHHAATTNFDIMPSVWATNVASAQYGIGQTGIIRAYVGEDKAAWACGNGNQYTINIECTNSTLGPDWKVSEATIDSLVLLIQEIQSRYGKLNIVGHRDVPGNSTLCPGPFLYPRLQEIRDRVANGQVKPVETQKKKRGNVMLLFRPDGDARVYWLVGNSYTHIKTEDDKKVIEALMNQAGYDTYVHTDLKQIEYIKKIATEKK